MNPQLAAYGVPYPFVIVMRFSTHHATTEGCATPQIAQRRIDELLAEFPTFRIQVLYEGARDVGPFVRHADLTTHFNTVPPQLREPAE